MEETVSFVDSLLQKFKPLMGLEYGKYRNHVCRVFLNCLLLDNDSAHKEKYAIAAVFHDIGIWTNHTIDYLDPSIAQATLYLNEKGHREWIEEITAMIYWHHKINTYQGSYQITTEVFRKADWMDVSLGLLTFTANRQKVKENRTRYPNLGFHFFLVKEVAKNFLRHPLNPLPMFKK